MLFLTKKSIFNGILGILSAFILASCDVSTPTVSGDNSVIPSNFRRVSYNDLPGWRDDDVRYALQAFRNSCKAKIQYTGRLIPDSELFAEKCRMLPSASADVAMVRAWFESNFQPYQIYNDNAGDNKTGKQLIDVPYAAERTYEEFPYKDHHAARDHARERTLFVRALPEEREEHHGAERRAKARPRKRNHAEHGAVRIPRDNHADNRNEHNGDSCDKHCGFLGNILAEIALDDVFGYAR